jgi:hypothetical protein
VTAEGAHQLQVSATDAAGNQATATRVVHDRPNAAALTVASPHEFLTRGSVERR